MLKIPSLVKKIFLHEWSLVVILSITMIAISFLPMYYQYKLTPPDHVFLGLHNSITDFPSLVSEIRQGQERRLAVVIRSTTEPQMGTWLRPYLFIGWLTSPFSIHPVVVYHLMRLVFGFSLLIVFYCVIRLFFDNVLLRLGAFWLTVIVGGFPKISLANGALSFLNEPYMNVFSGYDVLKRLTFVPHSFFRDILFLTVIIFLVKLFETKKSKFFWFAVFFGFFLGFTPSHSVIIDIMLVLGCLVIAMVKPPSINLPNYVKTIFAYILLTIPSSIYLIWVFEVTPWKEAKVWEAAHLPIVDFFDYALGTGPLFFLAIPAIFFFFLRLFSKNKQPFFKFFLLAGIPFITLLFMFLPINRFLGINSYRFLGIPLQVFWGILGSFTLITLAKWLSQKKKPNLSSFRLVLIFLILLTTLPIIPTYWISWQNQKTEFNPAYFNHYPPRDFYDGFVWLEKNTKPEEIVLSDFFFGNLALAYAGNTVYIGHYVSTINFINKKREVEFFYQTIMNPPEAYTFLTQRNIKYVVWSFDEARYGGNVQKYNFLKLRFNTPLIGIFEVL